MNPLQLRIAKKSLSQAERFKNLTTAQKAAYLVSNLVSGGGYLTPENLKKFIQLMIKQAVLLKEIRTMPMKSHTLNLDNFRFNNRVLKASVEGVPPASSAHANPTTARRTITAKYFQATVPISEESLQQQIEGPNWMSSLQAALADAISRDVEDTIVRGDTASADPDLNRFDGLFKLITTNTVDAANAAISIDLLEDMLKKMPVEFKSQMNRLSYYTSTNAEIEYRRLYANRATQLGDEALTRNLKAFFSSIPVTGIPVYPENIGTGNACTNVVLMDPKIFVLGIFQKMMMETDKDIVSRVNYIVCTMAIGCNAIEETALIKATNVNRTPP
jgi:HK97 family phage major capsid protein